MKLIQRAELEMIIARVIELVDAGNTGLMTKVVNGEVLIDCEISDQYLAVSEEARNWVKMISPVSMNMFMEALERNIGEDGIKRLTSGRAWLKVAETMEIRV